MKGNYPARMLAGQWRRTLRRVESQWRRARREMDDFFNRAFRAEPETAADLKHNVAALRKRVAAVVKLVNAMK